MAKIKTMMQTSEQTAATAEATGELIRTIVEVRRPKPRYVITPGRFQNWTVPSMLPHGWVDGLVGNMLGMPK